MTGGVLRAAERHAHMSLVRSLIQVGDRRMGSAGGAVLAQVSSLARRLEEDGALERRDGALYASGS